MPAIRWKATVLWPDGSHSTRICTSPAEVKTWFDQEVFCLKYRKILPMAVFVTRR